MNEPEDLPWPPLQSWSQAAIERRRALLFGSACFCAVTIGAVLAARVGVPLLTGSGSLARSDGYGDLRTATIISHPDDESRCRQQIYDNATGYLAGTPQPCNAKTDAASQPIPPDGTLHRLDSISRSFTTR